MVIVSPYAKRRRTDSTPATSASILRFTEKTFGVTALGVNDPDAYDYSGRVRLHEAGNCAARLGPGRSTYPSPP